MRPIYPQYNVYVHIDPHRRKLIYAGITCIPGRETDFSTRNIRHMTWLWTLLARGWRRNQIVHVVARNQDYEAALRLEQKLIAKFEPPFAQGRADTARAIEWLRMSPQPMPVKKPAVLLHAVWRKALPEERGQGPTYGFQTGRGLEAASDKLWEHQKSVPEKA